MINFLKEETVVKLLVVLLLVFCGGIFFDVVMYSYLRFDELLASVVGYGQSFFLLILLLSMSVAAIMIIFLYRQGSRLALVTISWLGFSSLVSMALYFMGFFAKTEPFELVGVVKQVSTYSLLLTLCYYFLSFSREGEER